MQIPCPTFRFSINFDEHTARTPLHAHDCAELVIVLGGDGMFVAANSRCAIEEGDGFVIAAHRQHGFENSHALRLCHINFDRRQLVESRDDLCCMPGYRALFDDEPRAVPSGTPIRRLHLGADDMVYITNLLAALKAEYEGRADGRCTMIRSTLLLLVTFLARAYERHENRASTPLVRMANVIAHIQKHFREALRVEELAHLAHWSCSQFQRAFKRMYRTTPLQFIHQVRIHEACELLKDPNLDITSVALRSGFPTSSVFSTRFKQSMGESPSEYRRRKMANHRLPLPRARNATVVPRLTIRMPAQDARL